MEIADTGVGLDHSVRRVEEAVSVGDLVRIFQFQQGHATMVGMTLPDTSPYAPVAIATWFGFVSTWSCALAANQAAGAMNHAVAENRVEDRVRNLIGDLVGVAFGNGFGGEKI